MNQVSLKIEYNTTNNLDKSYEFVSEENNRIIEGFFLQENSEKKMAVRKINVILCILLFAVIALTTVSYYLATEAEIALNDISRETVILNDENADLQNKLDTLKSFNNLDKSIQKTNLLTKAKEVIEIPAVNTSTDNNKKHFGEKIFSWSIGY